MYWWLLCVAFSVLYSYIQYLERAAVDEAYAGPALAPAVDPLALEHVARSACTRNMSVLYSIQYIIDSSGHVIFLFTVLLGCTHV